MQTPKAPKGLYSLSPNAYHLAAARLLRKRAPVIGRQFPVAQRAAHSFRVLAKMAAQAARQPKLKTGKSPPRLRPPFPPQPPRP